MWFHTSILYSQELTQKFFRRKTWNLQECSICQIENFKIKLIVWQTYVKAAKVLWYADLRHLIVQLKWNPKYENLAKDDHFQSLFGTRFSSNWLWIVFQRPFDWVGFWVWCDWHSEFGNGPAMGRDRTIQTQIVHL